MQWPVYIRDVSIDALRAELRASRKQSDADVGDDPVRVLGDGGAEGEEAEGGEDGGG